MRAAPDPFGVTRQIGPVARPGPRAGAAVPVAQHPGPGPGGGCFPIERGTPFAPARHPTAMPAGGR